MRSTPVRDSHWLRDNVRVVFAVVITAAAVLVAGFFIRAYQTSQGDEQICAEVEELRMNIRDFLELESELSDELIQRYFGPVDCSGL